MEENRVLNWAGLCLGSDDEVYRLQLSLKVVVLFDINLSLTLYLGIVQSVECSIDKSLGKDIGNSLGLYSCISDRRRECGRR